MDKGHNYNKKPTMENDQKTQHPRESGSKSLLYGCFIIAAIIDLAKYFYNYDEIVEYFGKSNSIFAYIVIHPWAHILAWVIIFAVLYQIIQYTSDKK